MHYLSINTCIIYTVLFSSISIYKLFLFSFYGNNDCFTNGKSNGKRRKNKWFGNWMFIVILVIIINKIQKIKSLLIIKRCSLSSLSSPLDTLTFLDESIGDCQEVSWQIGSDQRCQCVCWQLLFGPWMVVAEIMILWSASANCNQ